MRTQREIGWSLNGLDLTGEDANGVDWAIDVEGWDDPVAVTGAVNQKVYGDGGWVAPAFLVPHSLVLKARLSGPDRAAAVRAAEQFKAALPAREPAPLVLFDLGQYQHRRVMQEGKPTIRIVDGFVDISAQLVAPEPRKFSGDGAAGYTYDESTGLPTSTGGLQLGGSLPFQLNAAQTSGAIRLTNQGTAQAPVEILLEDVVNPSILAAGQRMDFNITVGPGQILAVDLDARTVKLNGVNRRNALTGPWIVPAPGTLLQLEATTYNPAARMTARWSDAWR